MVTHQSKILPLENGDRLSRLEFERRYRAMPELKKAELIEGRVYMASPVRIIHGQPHAYIMGWLAVYHAATPGTQFADNTTVRLDADNEPQPDALLRIEAGQSQIDVDDYIQGAPELIVEIAASTASYDLQEKLQVYRRNGVQEYLVWQVSDRIFDWFCLQDGEYIKLQPDKKNIIKSEVFPGLWLALDSLLNYDLAEVLKTVQQGLNTTEHQNFIRIISNQ
ncbi:Uma2 family endonuclease [Pleurocapsa sp. FMAR1]|uniref:Uma2 family endonuclease n=1 Tax=Pleurocapsa sp. FMAR1 TaxID=3040204 RepID=UPI0029C865B1|nr:Uma2 family endonuclease [Pleurocapsa sp. FMAR1]